ncbi:ATP-binding cassette domain-containing protein [Sanguibacter massiliensis]|uniref:ATP-binding cassette domain-containing protein n=1 Tax=Sanguibacter massiliensis TaxID=1973217 RepID=UPI000C83DE6E
MSSLLTTARSAQRTLADDRPAPPRPGAQEVRLVGLRRAFGDVVALDGLDLTVPAGSLVTLLGPSGCGKTTALRVLAGLEDVDAGAVHVGGRDVSHVPARRRDLAMVFQAYSLMPHMTVAENVAFALELRGLARRLRAAVVDEHLELVGLAERRDRYPHQLSGGQQQRVALARALAVRPSVLLLDEPLSALDATVRVQLREEIRRIQQQVGITTVLVTHDQTEALAISDLVAVMEAGRVVQVAPPEELYRRPVDGFVAEFVGETTRLPAIVVDGRAHLRPGTAWRGDLALLPGSLLPGAANGEVDVLVRPEHVRLVRVDGAGGTATDGPTVGRPAAGSPTADAPADGADAAPATVATPVGDANSATAAPAVPAGRSGTAAASVATARFGILAGTAVSAPSARVRLVTFLGAYAAAVVELPDGRTLRADVPADEAGRLRPGDEVTVEIADVAVLAVSRT